MKSMYPLRIAAAISLKGASQSSLDLMPKKPHFRRHPAIRTPNRARHEPSRPLSPRLPQIRCWRTGRRARSRPRPSSGSRRSNFRRPSRRRWRRIRPRSRRSPPTRRSPTSPTPSRRWSAPAARSAGCRTCSSRSPARIRATRSRRSSATCRPSSPPISAASISTPPCSAGWTPCSAPRATLGLTAEQDRVLERYHLSFRRAGAHLDDAARARLGAISERLATLGTAFSQNIIADERDYTLELDGEADLAGPARIRPRRRPQRRRGARHAGQGGGHALALERRAVPAVLLPARSARESRSAPSSRAATATGPPTTRRSSPKS